MPVFYDYQPAGQKWRQRNSNPPYEVDLDVLTHGRYSVVGGAIMDRLSRLSSVVDLSGPETHTLTVDDAGNYWLNTSTDSANVNRMSLGHISWKGVASGTVTLPTGHVVSLDNQIFAITKFNRQLWVRDVANPQRKDFIQVDVDRHTGDPKERIPRNYRPATSDEAIQYGIAGLIADKFKPQLQAMLDRARKGR